MSSAQNPSFVWDFSFLDPVYLFWDRKLVCLWFLWKGSPSMKEHRICGSENCHVDPVTAMRYSRPTPFYENLLAWLFIFTWQIYVKMWRWQVYLRRFEQSVRQLLAGKARRLWHIEYSMKCHDELGNENENEMNTWLRVKQNKTCPEFGHRPVATHSSTNPELSNVSSLTSDPISEVTTSWPLTSGVRLSSSGTGDDVEAGGWWVRSWNSSSIFSTCDLMSLSSSSSKDSPIDEQMLVRLCARSALRDNDTKCAWVVLGAGYYQAKNYRYRGSIYFYIVRLFSNKHCMQIWMRIEVYIVRLWEANFQVWEL